MSLQVSVCYVVVIMSPTNDTITALFFLFLVLVLSIPCISKLTELTFEPCHTVYIFMAYHTFHTMTDVQGSK